MLTLLSQKKVKPRVINGNMTCKSCGEEMKGIRDYCIRDKCVSCYPPATLVQFAPLPAKPKEDAWEDVRQYLEDDDNSTPPRAA